MQHGRRGFYSENAGDSGIIADSALRGRRSLDYLNVLHMKKWRCLVCDFEYDEAKGLPMEGIPAGTKWEDIPEDWTCPDCGVGKSDFIMVEAD